MERVINSALLAVGAGVVGTDGGGLKRPVVFMEVLSREKVLKGLSE